MTLTFKLDLDILPLDLPAKFRAGMSVRSATNARHTDTRAQDAKTITTSADAGCNEQSLNICGIGIESDAACPPLFCEMQYK